MCVCVCVYTVYIIIIYIYIYIREIPLEILAREASCIQYLDRLFKAFRPAAILKILYQRTF